MLFVAGNKTPRVSGNQKFEKDGVAASGLRRDLGGVRLKKTRHVKNTNQNPLASQSRRRLEAGREGALFRLLAGGE